MNSSYVSIIEKNHDLPTLIVFSPENTAHGSFKSYQLDSVDANLILVNCDRNTWYQKGIPGLAQNYTDSAIKLVSYARAIGNGNVFTLGSSMGAYAAILYGIIGGVDACMAFGTESTLLLQGSRSEKNMKSGVELSSIQQIVKQSNIPVYLFASEHNECDIRATYELAPCQNVTVMTVTGHPSPGAIQYFESNNLLAEMVNAFVKNNLFFQIFKRKGDLFEHLEVAQAVLDVHSLKRMKAIDKCLIILERTLVMHPESSPLLFLLGNTHQSLHEGEKSKIAWQKSITFGQYNYEAYGKLTNYFRASKSFDQAFIHAYKAIEIYPTYANSYYHLALLYKDIKDNLKAIDAVNKAIALNKKNKLYTDLLNNLV